MKKNIDKIINECINSVIEEKMTLKEYKDPKYCEVVKTCADQLQLLHDDIVGNGMSRHEITVEDLQKAINMLRKVQHMMGC